MRSLLLSGACVALIAAAGCSNASKDAPAGEAAEAEAKTANAAPAADAAAPAGEAAPAPTATQAAPSAAAYTPVEISAEDHPGRARQIRCQIGSDPEVGCTFTPLFGDGSFQLDGPDIALRMVVSDGEAYLFEVFGPERRVGIGGLYTRDKRDTACWVSAEESSAPSRVCAR